MNTEGLFQAGDEVHHASTPNLIWWWLVFGIIQFNAVG